MAIFSVPDNNAFDTYGELTDAISAWMDRSDLTGVVQSMIALAEAKMRRVLMPYWQETSVDLPVTDGVATLPDDFGVLSIIRFGQRSLPQYSAAEALQIKTATEPYGFTIESGGLRLWPVCDATVTVIYRPTLPQLSESNPTNMVLSAFPDAYFFGAMTFAEGYVANDSRAAGFKGLFEEALAEVVRYLTRQAFAGSLQPRLNVYP